MHRCCTSASRVDAVVTCGSRGKVIALQSSPLSLQMYHKYLKQLRSRSPSEIVQLKRGLAGMFDILLTFCRRLVHSDDNIQGALWAFRGPLGDLVSKYTQRVLRQVACMSPTAHTSDRTIRTTCPAQIACERSAHVSRVITGGHT